MISRFFLSNFNLRHPKRSLTPGHTVVSSPARYRQHVSAVERRFYDLVACIFVEGLLEKHGGYYPLVI